MSAEDTKHQKVDSTKIPPDPRAPYPDLQILISSIHSLFSSPSFAEAGHLGSEFSLGEAGHSTDPSHAPCVSGGWGGGGSIETSVPLRGPPSLPSAP